MIKYSSFKLDNGLQVFVHEDPTVEIAAMNILYNVGSRDEQPDKTGFAHLFEHLMFGGSVNIPSYDEPLQMVGGENNAFTNTDITNYYLKMGVIGGLPLMLAFVWILLTTFRLVGRGIEEMYHDDEDSIFACWCIGAALFAHSVTFLSVSYFDQNGILLAFVIGIAPALLASDDGAEPIDLEEETTGASPERVYVSR